MKQSKLKIADHQIQSFLIMKKGTIEKCKEQIDMYFTMRSIFTDVFVDSNPFSARMLQVHQTAYHVPLPKHGPNFTRVTVIKVKNSDDLDIYANVADLINVAEIRLLEDVSDGELLIFDGIHCNMNFLKKVSPMVIKILYTINERALKSRLIGLHIINAPAFVDQILTLVKAIIKPKLASRFVVHKDIESLLKVIPKEVLPKDYGGDEKSLDELQELYSKKIEEYREFFDQRDQWKVDEELRPSNNLNNDLYSWYGSFRKLESLPTLTQFQLEAGGVASVD
ncbi:hypothetical protein NQ318_002255 [Aromia moschata]|uniref:CRAL-TRIO domain-containing protein n=1 Tax=Aromia moschata TaxID=1265417 RepID=A0AAV8Z345_9CUCU|nr:hypothetical protein NQ318_002255 [Aromia moschata]